MLDCIHAETCSTRVEHLLTIKQQIERPENVCAIHSSVQVCVQLCPGLQHDLHIITRGTKILFPANIVRIQCVLECVRECVYNSTIAFCQGGCLLM